MNLNQAPKAATMCRLSFCDRADHGAEGSKLRNRQNLYRRLFVAGATPENTFQRRCGTYIKEARARRKGNKALPSNWEDYGGCLMAGLPSMSPPFGLSSSRRPSTWPSLSRLAEAARLKGTQCKVTRRVSTFCCFLPLRNQRETTISQGCC